MWYNSLDIPINTSIIFIIYTRMTTHLERCSKSDLYIPANTSSMKGKVLPIVVLLIGTMILLSIPAMGRMMGPGSDTGNGPMMDHESKRGPLEKGFAYRYGSGSPTASIENDEASSGIEISMESITHERDGKNQNIALNQTDWEVTESENDSAKTVTYKGNCTWKENGNVSRITLNFHYRWGDDNRSIDIDLKMDDPPGNGNMTMRMKIGSEGLGDDCCLDPKQQKGHRFHYNNQKGERLGELVIEEEANIETSEGNGTVSTDIEMESLGDSQNLMISSSISDNIESYSVSGSFRIFEEMMHLIGEAGDDAVSYVKEHIVSFAIGTALVITVIALSVIFISKKQVQTGGNDLDLENNRYYRKD